MNYDYIPYVHTAIDNALQSADEGRDILLEVAEICSEVMDMSEYIGMIHSAARKIHRLENYRRAFDEYADGVQELENRMSSGFIALKNEYEEMKDGKWERVAEIVCNETARTTKSQIVQKPDTKIRDVSDDGTKEPESVGDKIDAFMDTSFMEVICTLQTYYDPLVKKFDMVKTVYDILIKDMTYAESKQDTVEFIKGFIGSGPKVVVETVTGIIELPETLLMIGNQISEYGFCATMGNIVGGTIEKLCETIENDLIHGDSRSRGEFVGRATLAVGEVYFGTKGISQGIKGAGAVKKTATVIDKFEDAVDVVEDVAENAKKVEKIIDASEMVEDVAENAKKVEKIIDASETVEEVTENARKVEKIIDASESGSNTFGNYSTKIDSKVTVVEKQELPSWLIDTYKDGVYRTVVTNEDITVYRSFGYNAEAGGAFATSSPAVNRIQTKVDSAILPEWKNTLRYEAEIVIPKGTTLNIGRVGEQFTMSGTRLAGDADQFLLPQNWDLNWIKSIREVKP